MELDDDALNEIEAFIRLRMDIREGQDCKVGNHFAVILMNFDGDCASGGFKTSLCREHFCNLLEIVSETERKDMAKEE